MANIQSIFLKAEACFKYLNLHSNTMLYHKNPIILLINSMWWSIKFQKNVTFVIKGLANLSSIDFAIVHMNFVRIVSNIIHSIKLRINLPTLNVQKMDANSSLINNVKLIKDCLLIFKRGTKK